MESICLFGQARFIFLTGSLPSLEHKINYLGLCFTIHHLLTDSLTGTLDWMLLWSIDLLTTTCPY